MRTTLFFTWSIQQRTQNQENSKCPQKVMNNLISWSSVKDKTNDDSRFCNSSLDTSNRKANYQYPETFRVVSVLIKKKNQ